MRATPQAPRGCESTRKAISAEFLVRRGLPDETNGKPFMSCGDNFHMNFKLVKSDNEKHNAYVRCPFFY